MGILVLPFKGKAGSCGMMPGDGSCLRIGPVIVCDDQSVYRVRVLPVCDFVGPPSDGFIHILAGRGLDIFPVYCLHPIFLNLIHPVTPVRQLLFRIDESERNPLQMPLLHFQWILEGQGAGSQVTGVGVVFITLQKESFEIVVGDDTFPSDHGVAFIGNVLGDAPDRLCKMGDIRSDMPVSTCNHFREVSPVKGDYERQPVEFPGEPYGFAAGPLDQIFGFLRLRQREGRKFMSFFLPVDLIG